MGERANMERMITIMTACQWWIGQKVALQCRVATPDEIEAARAKAAEEEDDHHIPHGNEGDARLFRMMEDIHKLAVSPHGETLRIPSVEWSPLQRMKQHLRSGFMRSDKP